MKLEIQTLPSIMRTLDVLYRRKKYSEKTIIKIDTGEEGLLFL